MLLWHHKVSQHEKVEDLNTHSCNKDWHYSVMQKTTQAKLDLVQIFQQSNMTLSNEVLFNNTSKNALFLQE